MGPGKKAPGRPPSRLLPATQRTDPDLGHVSVAVALLLVELVSTLT